MVDKAETGLGNTNKVCHPSSPQSHSSKIHHLVSDRVMRGVRCLSALGDVQWLVGLLNHVWSQDRFRKGGQHLLINGISLEKVRQ